MTKQFAITAVDADLPLLGAQRLRFSSMDGGGSRSTVLVGRNGTGKSTILRELAMTFRAYFAARELRSRQGLGIVSRIEIESDGERAQLNVKADVRTFRSERAAVRDLGGGPTKLIALSFTPFDKFPPADDTNFRDRPDAAVPFYVYLGFKSDVRISPRGRLLRSIDQLAFADSTPLSDQRVVDALEAIGYGPVIKISYQLDMVNAHKRGMLDKARINELAARLRSGPDASGTRRGELSYLIDFRFGRRDPSVQLDFEEVRELSRANVLRLSSVTLDRLENGQSVELLELSSGELNLLSGFLGLAAFLEDGCLVLIDEPENSLHPAWQLQYVQMLDAVLKRHCGCHYVIATHSPLVVSGLSEGRANVLRLDQMPIEMASETVSRASPDATLLNAFRVVTAGNNFLKQLVLEALTFIETGRQKDARAVEIASFIASVLEQIPAGDPIRDLAANVAQMILAPDDALS